jgi:NAD(P)H-flavin reductase/quinol-cytochrome oxidoreductase complex cytochrome b subunit
MAPPAAPGTAGTRRESVVLKLVQRAGRQVFLWVERLFNHAFGEASNPLYCLGAISYFLFWVVLATGLYLYAFFNTGVDEAYASVERLTRQQWYAGGVIRSLHRYASDGMVLAMLLHLGRHFLFDHYRGIRWFSWLSGVVVLWMVYVSGINGYMLPWDRLAQFVTLGTTEWLDRLPIFNGALARNFIFEGAVNDRLFSLLSFLHIGFPLGVLALLWIHTQRVPSARTNPPAPIMIWLMGSLLLLSLAKPAVSQGPADLSTVPTTLALDWFYLPIFPLFYRWTVGEVWLLVVGATMLTALLPWLPPKWRRRREAFHLIIAPDNRIVEARPGETVLDCALRDGIVFPFDCRNGGCGVCKCSLVQGSVDYGAYQREALTDQERRAGMILACCATPLSDLQLEYTPKVALGGIAPGRHRARVEAMELLAEDVMRVRLVCEGGQVRFHAGQYLNILLAGKGGTFEKRSFSFATAPHEGGPIELHIRLIPGGRFTTHVFNGMKPGDEIEFEAPLGAFSLREDGRKPMIFVAGATGFAPVKSMLEHAFHAGIQRRMVLYWGVRSKKDLYLAGLPERWAAEHPNFSYVPVLSAPRPEDQWTGRTGLVHEAVLQDHPTLAGFQVYACGSVNMVEAAHPAFASRGLSQEDCFSDAFRLAPHIAARTAAGDLIRLGGRADHA